MIRASVQGPMQCNESMLRSAKVCHYAFLSRSEARRYPHLEHMSRITNDKTGVSLDIWKSGDTSSIICFRGSASLQNLVTYARNSHIKFHYCDKQFHIHKGVYTMFQSIHSDILYSIPIKGHTLTFVGYSLGGALAMYAATYVALMTPMNKIECHTFGTPMVGDMDFIKTFEAHVGSMHVVNQFDIVPHLLQYPFHSSVKYMRVSSDSMLCIHSKHPLKSFFQPLYSHDITTYIDNIEHHLQEQRIR